MASTSSSDPEQAADPDEPKPLDDPSGFGPVDIAGHEPPTSDDEESETAGDPELHLDPEAGPTS